MQAYSIYIHIPFCKCRCNYCDFNTFAGKESRISDYLDALQCEILAVGKSAPQRLPVHTVYFGGGTPSLLPLSGVQSVMQTLEKAFDFQSELEVTMEANPGTVSLDYLTGLHQAGINRLSFGMQSAHPDDLRLLGRIHTFEDVIRAVRWSRQAQFDNLSLDLIYGLPFQTLERWEKTLEWALMLQPEHLSLYSLTIEPGTPFYRWAKRGLIPMPEDDLGADMVELAESKLAQAGFQQYEISNWARKNGSKLYASRHNLQYWVEQPYLGFGAGAHGYAMHSRTINVSGIEGYIQRMRTPSISNFPASPAAAELNRLSLEQEMQETMMVGLRLTEEGVSKSAFELRFGQPLESVFGREINRLTAWKLLEWVGENKDRLRLTPRGRLVGNQVFLYFVGDEPED